MNYFEKIRDNFIPINNLLDKFFYTDKVASLFLKIPYQELNQETALVNLLSKGFTKYRLLQLYKKQKRYELKIHKAMSKFRVYDTRIRKYIQLVNVKYGQGIEYLLLGEILEREYGFKFDFTPEQIAEDNGYALCAEIEQVLNRLSDYFKSNDKRTLKAIQQMTKEQQLALKLENEE